MGDCRQIRGRTQKFAFAMETKGIPALTWIEVSLRAIPHKYRKEWQSRVTRSVQNKAFIYVRAEYPLAISRLQTAIRQAKQHGYSVQEFLSRHTTSMSIFALGPEHSSVGKKRH